MTISKTFLAGDLGGTKTYLALYKWDNQLIKHKHKRYISADWQSLEDMLNPNAMK